MKLVVGKGPVWGLANTVAIVAEDGHNWPIIKGAGGPGDPQMCIMVPLMDGIDNLLEPDPRIAFWPNDFQGVLRTLAASDPTGMVFFAAVAPVAGTLLVLHHDLTDYPVSYATKLLRAVYGDVEASDQVK